MFSKTSYGSATLLTHPFMDRITPRETRPSASASNKVGEFGAGAGLLIRHCAVACGPFRVVDLFWNLSLVDSSNFTGSSYNTRGSTHVPLGTLPIHRNPR